MLKKMVNGIEVIMSDAEEAAVRAEWAANEAKAGADAPVISARKAQILNIKQRLRALNDLPDLTAAEVKETIIKLIKLKVLQDEL